jgi:2-polyprenyl-6-methoxyphenol hydroxylase-like FAD-dependent oxidoreductase
VYGATPGGILAAVAVRREGRSAVVVEPSQAGKPEPARHPVVGQRFVPEDALSFSERTPAALYHLRVE